MADGDTGSGELDEIFRDPLLADLAVPRFEIAEVLGNAPGVAEAVTRLCAALVDRRRTPMQEAGGAEITATDWVRDHIGANRNHFAELDEAAEARPIAGFSDAAARLQDEHRARCASFRPRCSVGPCAPTTIIAGG